MGAKTWMLVYSDGAAAAALRSGAELDRAKTAAFVHDLFPKEKLIPIADGDLMCTSPPKNTIYAGCVSGVYIVAASEFGLDYPSTLPLRFLSTAYGTTIHLHAMHSVVDWFAFAVWTNGQLERSLSVSLDSGVIEDIGARRSFELPFWKGEYPAIDPEDDDEGAYPLPFHPLELGEAALGDFFGFVMEGFAGLSSVTPALVEPEDVPLLGFKRARRWWPFG